MQEIFTTPYFCAEQQTRWYEAVERIPDGPTVRLMQEVAKEHGMVIIVPIYEEELTGIYYNTAAVIDADGSISASIARTTFRTSIPVSGRSFTVRQSRLSVFRYCVRSHRRVHLLRPSLSRRCASARTERRGDRFQSVATVAGLSEYLWRLEQPAHAVANGYFIGAINRIGHEQPWDIGEFYGQSYFCDPRGVCRGSAAR